MHGLYVPSDGLFTSPCLQYGFGFLIAEVVTVDDLTLSSLIRSEKTSCHCCLQIWCVFVDNFVETIFKTSLTRFLLNRWILGDMVVNICLMLLIFVKILNVCDVNWEPLSVMMYSGTPYLAKQFQSLVIIDELVMFFMMYRCISPAILRKNQ
jgi:hypothetical protein